MLAAASGHILFLSGLYKRRGALRRCNNDRNFFLQGIQALLGILQMLGDRDRDLGLGGGAGIPTIQLPCSPSCECGRGVASSTLIAIGSGSSSCKQ